MYTPLLLFKRVLKSRLLVVCLLTCIIVFPLNAGEPESKERPEARPNIIFLLADDLRYDVFGYMGNSIISTPNIDQLASEGTVFRNAYVATSICAISRASIFTGQYAQKHQILDFITPFSDSARKLTYPNLLKEQGYVSGFIGKYGVGNKMPKDDFDYWRGFGGMGSYNQKDAAGNYKHLTDLMGDQALEFLGKQQKKPFCLSISFKAPHVEGTNLFLPDPVYDDLYVSDSIPFPTTGDDKYFEAFPDVFKVKNEARERWQVRFSTPELFQENVKKYYRLINGIDQVIKRIRVQLKKQGLDRNTIIVLSSDNGFYLGEHGLAGKWFGHEESIRVPLIILDPRNSSPKKSSVRKDIALNVDLAPTILDYAGVEKPASMQGFSLRPLVEGQKIPWRKEFYYDHLLESSTVYIPKSEGIVSASFKYMRYYTQKDSDNFIYEELFNTAFDPFERDNLASDPENAMLKKEMIARMKQLKQDLHEEK